MKAALRVHSQAPHQFAAMKAMQDGFKKHGIESRIVGRHEKANADLEVIWSARQLDAVDKRVPVLILECGYINSRTGIYKDDRLRYVSFSWNELHGLSHWQDGLDYSRAASMFSAARWHFDDRSQGKIIVAGQVTGDYCAPSLGWTAKIITEASKFYGVDRVVHRPHPLEQRSQQTLVSQLESAYMLITWSSTAAVEAVLEGVPVCVFSRGSIAYPVASNDIKVRAMPDPNPWLANIACRQFTHREMESGMAWDYQRGGYDALST